MGKQVVNLTSPPNPRSSSAVIAGGLIFVSGRGGVKDSQGNKIETIEGQVKQSLENIREILEAAGASISDAVKMTVFLGDVSNFAKMNEAYQAYLTGFTKELPARSTVVTGLVNPDMLIEIECVACHPAGA